MKDALYQPVYGLRVFRVENGRLLALTNGHQYHDGWNTNRTTPEKNGANGFWSCKTWVDMYTAVMFSDRHAVGIVELGGTVVEHRDGYRSEKLRIVALYYEPDYYSYQLVGPSNWRRQQIKDRYPSAQFYELETELMTRFLQLCEESLQAQQLGHRIVHRNRLHRLWTSLGIAMSISTVLTVALTIALGVIL